jgi:lysophospholipase L1-like esterase
MKKKTGSWKLNITLLVAGLALAAIIGELVVRVCAPQQLIVMNAELWKPDSSGLGWKHGSLVSSRIDLGEAMVSFISDSDGHRINSREDDDTNAHASLAILGVGDSYLEALQVQNGNSMTQVLRRQLADSMGEDVYVANPGVSGYDLGQYYLVARSELLRRHYNLGLLFFYVGNDFGYDLDTSLTPRKPAERHRFSLPRQISTAAFKQSIAYPVNDYLEETSHLFVFLKAKFNVILARMGLTAYYFPAIFQTAMDGDSIWTNTGESLETIAGLFHDNHTPLLIVIIPTPYQVHEKEFERYIHMFKIDRSHVDLELPNRLLNEQLRRRQLQFIDLLAPLRRQSAATDKRLYGLVDNHFNEAGHSLVGQALAPEVLSVLRKQQ